MDETDTKDQNKSYKHLSFWTQILYTCKLSFYFEEIDIANGHGCIKCVIYAKKEKD